ncbi:MAG: NAD(P)-binding domain-containing protein, partial [Brachybacterium sp.]|nr:NAD(P)-binding domain-containing protein [Brachybacterium sp.]
ADRLARGVLRAAAGIPERRGVARPGDGPHTQGRTVGAVPAVRSVGIIGVGRIGTALARQALRRGLRVHVAGRSMTAGDHLPGAVTTTVPDLARRSDVVVLTVPLSAAFELDSQALAGAVVVDATNPWGDADHLSLARARERLTVGRPCQVGSASSSEVLAAHLRDSHVVKSLNHIGYHDVEDHARPSSADDRRAIVLAGDDARARARVAELLDHLGFDATDLGGLAEGHRLEPGAALFGA